jgi:excisionase family DNA binding protein
MPDITPNEDAKLNRAERRRARVVRDALRPVEIKQSAWSQEDVITTTIAGFMRVTGLGLTTTYRLLNAGDLQSIMVGRRRLIVLESWRAYVERHRGSPAEAPLASPPRNTRAARTRRRGEPLLTAAFRD